MVPLSGIQAKHCAFSATLHNLTQGFPSSSRRINSRHLLLQLSCPGRQVQLCNPILSYPIHPATQPKDDPSSPWHQHDTIVELESED
eukprot:1061519-Pelagomonas_calceolata.AAC.11